jgi:hypothetical protein
MLTGEDGVAITGHRPRWRSILQQNATTHDFIFPVLTGDVLTSRANSEQERNDILNANLLNVNYGPALSHSVS